MATMDFPTTLYSYNMNIMKHVEMNHFSGLELNDPHEMTHE